MSPQADPPHHALFLQWRELKAGAYGIPAIVTLGLIVLALVAWTFLGGH